MSSSATISAALAAARARSQLPDFIGEAELYCQNSDCTFREVVVTIKEHDGPTTPARLVCPACRRTLKVHHILTLEEQRAVFERDARVSVNVQRYLRRTSAFAVPIGVLLDDSLPKENRQ
jgi:hypothetical protein